MKPRHVLFAFALVLLSSATITPSISSSEFEPINNYHFRVEIDGLDAGRFREVDGLSIELEVNEFQNGDDPLIRKRPGRVKYGDITLKKGYVASSILNDWIEEARFSSGGFTRKTVAIVLQDSKENEIKRWNLFETFPRSWKMSSLDGKGNDILTEEMVIVIEWFEEA